MTSSVARPSRSSKALSKAKPAPKKVMVTVLLFGGLLPIWSTRAFWILVKPLHLRSMLSKLIRCTENSNASRPHWSTEDAQFFSMTMPDCTLHYPTSKVEWIGLQSFASSSIFNWPLTYYHFFKHLHNFLQEITSTNSRRQKMLSKSSFNPEAQIFTLQE